MANKYESANLLLKLYEIRREDTLRKARDWFIGFNPNSAQDVIDTIRGKDGAFYRMVVSYWDMAASFVNHDVIDEEMFNDTILEHIAVYSKIQPYMEELRAIFGEPGYLKHLEKLVMRVPNIETRLSQMRKRMKVIAATNEKDDSRPRHVLSS
ncbi:MAG: hypothetical protein L0220_32095 [Acidobacteria bacterium]|nr:hypothetical protein [Acidobacteriota bacterium]